LEVVHKPGEGRCSSEQSARSGPAHWSCPKITAQAPPDADSEGDRDRPRAPATNPSVAQGCPRVWFSPNPHEHRRFPSTVVRTAEQPPAPTLLGGLRVERLDPQSGGPFTKIPAPPNAFYPRIKPFRSGNISGSSSSKTPDCSRHGQGRRVGCRKFQCRIHPGGLLLCAPIAAHSGRLQTNHTGLRQARQTQTKGRHKPDLDERHVIAGPRK